MTVCCLSTMYMHMLRTIPYIYLCFVLFCHFLKKTTRKTFLVGTNKVFLVLISL